MLKFIGKGDTSSLEVGIYGDGTTRDISINLAKAPFEIAWKGFYPKNINITDQGSAPAKTVTLTGDTLIIIFSEPPPETDWSGLDDPLVPFSKPEIYFTVHFIYGTGVTGRKSSKSSSKSGRRG